jgi:hypothetical protein
MPISAPIYRPRNPKQTPYYRCVVDHLETLEQVYEERFERNYGFFRPMSNRLWSGFWTAMFSKTALPGSSAKTAAMNTYRNICRSPHCLRRIREAKRVVRPNFNGLPPLFPLSTSIGNFLIGKVPFSSEIPSVNSTSDLFLSLIVFFPFFIILPSKSNF